MKHYLALGLLSSLLLTSCSVDWNDAKDSLHKKKVDCLQSVEALKNIRRYSIESGDIREYRDIFYKNTSDECLVGYDIQGRYLIIDSLTFKEYLNTVCSSNYCTDAETILNKDTYAKKWKELTGE